MNCDALAERFMNRLAEGVIEMGFPAQNQGKTVDGIIAVIHEHLDVIENTGAQVLCFINGKEQGLSFFLIQVINLLLNGAEHTGFPAFVGHPEDSTELLVEISNTDCGQADVFHVEEAGIQAGSKTTQAEGLPQAGSCSKNTNAPYVLEIVQAVCHLGKVMGDKVVFFLHLLFVKGIEG